MLAPHRAALARARDQLLRLAAAERDFLAATPYRLVHEHDVRAGRYVVRVQVVREIPDELAHLAHGVARTLRESIDLLATSLAGAPVMFPIHESLAMFAQRARKPIARMSDEAQATLESLQPYHAIGGFRNGPLWTLQQLDGAAPPRLAGSIRGGGAMGVNTQRGVSILGDPEIQPGTFDDRAVVASVATRVVGADPKLDMFLRVDYAIAYARAGPGRGRDVLSALETLCDHVEQAVFARLPSD